MSTTPSPDAASDRIITVIVREDHASESVRKDRGEDRGLTLLSDHMRAARVPVPASALEKGMEEFIDSMKGAIGRVTTTIGEFRLDTVTLSAEVNAKGKLELLGTGGEVGGKAGITFEFKREALTQGEASPKIKS